MNVAPAIMIGAFLLVRHSAQVEAAAACKTAD
jgi:hypothetical protein